MAATLKGRGFWVWYVNQCGGIAGIIEKAKRTGCTWVAIKAGDGADVWDQFTDELVREIQAAGIEVYAWAYCYGDDYQGEIAVAHAALSKNVNGFIADVEAECEGKTKWAEDYADVVRRWAGDRIFAYAPLPWIDYHQALPYVQFNKHVDLVMPQFYTVALGDRVTYSPENLAKQWEKWWGIWFPTGTAIKVAPIGETFGEATAADVARFENWVASRSDVDAWSYWSMQHATAAHLDVLHNSVPGIAPPVVPLPPLPPTPPPLPALDPAIQSALDNLFDLARRARPSKARRAEALVAINRLRVAFGLPAA